MKYALAVALLLLLVFQVTGLARPEIECPNLSAFDLNLQKARHAAESYEAGKNLRLACEIAQGVVGLRIEQNGGNWNGGTARDARQIERDFAKADYLQYGGATQETFFIPTQDLKRARENTVSLSLPGLPRLWDAMETSRR